MSYGLWEAPIIQEIENTAAEAGQEITASDVVRLVDKEQKRAVLPDLDRVLKTSLWLIEHTTSDVLEKDRVFVTANIYFRRAENPADILSTSFNIFDHALLLPEREKNIGGMVDSICQPFHIEDTEAQKKLTSFFIDKGFNVDTIIEYVRVGTPALLAFVHLWVKEFDMPISNVEFSRPAWINPHINYQATDLIN